MWLSRSLEFKLALGAFGTWIREANEIQKFGSHFSLGLLLLFEEEKGEERKK